MDGGQLCKTYELKTQPRGPCASGESEGNLLNRIVRWERGGWQLEADPRHGGLLTEQFGLQVAKGFSAPANDDDDKEEHGDSELLTGNDITLLRCLAARCNHVSLDRADPHFSAKEICR